MEKCCEYHRFLSYYVSLLMFELLLEKLHLMHDDQLPRLLTRLLACEKLLEL